MGTRATGRPVRVAQAPPGGFEELFVRERAAMVRLAYLVCGSAAVAEEVTHDAFVRVYQRWGRLDRPGAYLRRCVVNRAIDAKARRRHGDELTRSLAVADAAPAVHDHTLDAVLRLPPKARAMVVLRFYEQLSVDER